MENIFDTSVLVQVVPNLKTSQNWLLDRFFPNVVTYETEEVAIDVDVGLRRMAPFVSPLVEGKLVESRKYQTNTFKPAYIKDKRAPDLRKPIRRQIGERIGGEYTAAEREMLNLQFEMTDQIDMINRRLEWMAASALVSGTVTVNGVLTSENDMHTAIIISLFTDGLARADDDYEGTDRRGWWGDLDSDLNIGSRLWLLRREKLTREVAMRAENYAEEALAWMKSDGIAAAIEAQSEIVFPNRLNLIIRYLPPAGDWQEFKFFWLWEQLNNAI